MTTVLLIRHAVNDWVKTGKLAGWKPGIHLNAEGEAQARALGRESGCQQPALSNGGQRLKIEPTIL